MKITATTMMRIYHREHGEDREPPGFFCISSVASVTSVVKKNLKVFSYKRRIP
jgi:hypothetical protein